MQGMNNKTLVVPKWPHVANLNAWLIQLGKNLVDCSSFDDCAEMGWIEECKHKTFEQLLDSGEPRFRKLDLKLANTLYQAYKDQEDAVR